MRDLIFKSDPTVNLLQYMGSDHGILRAARVSVEDGEFGVPAPLLQEGELEGLIRYLTKHRHGTPFEHNGMTVEVHVPIFVVREWQRHRIAWSYSEGSARYKPMAPIFHMPAPDRPLINVGTSARPKMAPGTPEQYERLVARMKSSYHYAYVAYLQALEDGVAKEVAREVLPVGIYTRMHATFNLRSALAFLSLRTHEPDAAYVSYPQYEIEQAARMIEQIVADLFPIAYSAFCEHGRVAP